MATPAPSTSDTSPPPIAAEYPPPTSSSQTPPPIAVEPPPAAPPPIAAEPPPAAPPPIAVDPPPSAPPPIATESPPIIAPPPLSVEPPPMAPPPLAVEPPPLAPSPLPVEPPPAITPPPLPVDQPPPNIAAPPSPVEPPPAAPPPLPVDQPPSPPTLSSPPSLPPSYPPPPLPYDSPHAPPPAPGLPPETSYTPPSPINFAPPPPPPPPYVPPPPNSTHNPPPPPSPLQSPPPPLPPQTNTTSNSTSNTTTSAFPSPPARLGPPTPSTSESTTSTAIGVSIAAAVAVSLILLLAGCIAKNRNKKKRKDYYNNQYYCPPGAQNVQHYQDGYNREGQWNRPYPPSESGIKLGAPSLSPYSPNPSGAMGGGSSYQYSGSTGYPSGGFGSIGPPSTSGGGPPGSSVSSLHQFAGASKSCFTYEELMAATEGFSTANVLGEGGFGKVYKGMLPEGKVVAVKQLKAGGGQGEREFQAEVEIISRVHHRHLVSLVGFCIADSHRLLVYEFVPNGTLEHHLHGRGVATMDWPTRMKIAIGAARGLAYLHEDCHPRIIHRDIKSANILIDNNFEAQVADFGLAKLTEDTSTHVTTRVMGTFGYLAPEYAASGKLTDRSDVFSFGVVLLELLTGRKPVDGSQPMGSESLVEWSRPLLAQVLEEGNLELMADPKLNGAYDSTEMMRMVEAASASVRYSAQKRPRMSHVVRALEDDIALSELNKAGGRPGQSSIFSGTQSSEYSVGQYSADMKKFREIALNEQDSDSDSSAATTEYGLNPSDSSGEYPLSKDFHGKHSSTSHQPHKKNESSGSGYSLR